MAILFEWYENPVAPNQPQEETKLHARITLNGKTGTDRLRRKIQERCSLTETDVSAVLDALSHAMGEELAEGRQVHLDGIGYFHPTLTCTEEIKEDTKRKNTKVRLKGIKFRADQELRSEIGNVKLKNIKHNGHSNKLSGEEIDSRLTIYFSQHHMMTRSDFQRVCGMMKSTIMGHIRRLCGEGKLKNIRLQNQLIYAPNVGYYGITEEVTMRKCKNPA